ncbi:hypothetical protein LTR86_009338 [Recurvomyces mirabilis]|nr:hypothetical protein LTR86_009338 [Recurvomyces mirabilis]
MADDLLNRVEQALREDPETTTLDSKLFEEAELLLPSYLAPPTSTTNNAGSAGQVVVHSQASSNSNNDGLWEKRLLLMRHLAADLTDSRRSNHTPIVDLLIKLFNGFTWTQVCEFGTSSIPYKDGLGVGEGMTSFNRLMLCLLGKATGKASDAEQAAGMLEVMVAVVRLWLTTPDTGISMQAGELLFDLLKVDVPPQPAQLRENWRDRTAGEGGQGLVWKRVFGDRDVYHVFFESCSLEHGAEALSKNQRTIAQARLMEWVPKVARLDWGMISRSHHREIEGKFKSTGGFLDFVALKMVDFKDDLLMYRCLIDFFSLLLRTTADLDTHTMAQHDSLGLQYLIMHGLHARTAAIYLQTHPVDPAEAMLLYGPAANYLSTYASEYPKHYLAGQMAKQVNERLLHILDLTPGRWAHNDSPKHDLHLITGVPRQSLMPYDKSPISLLPCKTTNADVLNTLATIFHGPEEHVVTFPATEVKNAEQDSNEGAAARAIYFYYLAAHPHFWRDIVTHAETIALRDLALSAIRCITAIINANWSNTTTPATITYPLPSTTLATPNSGHLAILSPPALEHILPYLLSPPKTFANLVGGRGDAESSAYQVAAAKFEALKALEVKMRGQVERSPDEGFEEILGTVQRRLGMGVLPQGAEVGGAVGTMEL